MKSATLKARAIALAREPESQQASAGLEVIEFGIAHERYAVETAYVFEVHPLEELTPLPCTPSFVAGLINVRGRIVAVIDIRKFFDLPEPGIADAHRVIVVHLGEIEVGLLADAVAGVRSIPVAAIQSSLPTLTGVREEYLKGVTSEQLVILDVPRILTDQKIIVHEEVETSANHTRAKGISI